MRIFLLLILLMTTSSCSLQKKQGISKSLRVEQHKNIQKLFLDNRIETKESKYDTLSDLIKDKPVHLYVDSGLEAENINPTDLQGIGLDSLKIGTKLRERCEALGGCKITIFKKKGDSYIRNSDQIMVE